MYHYLSHGKFVLTQLSVFRARAPSRARARARARARSRARKKVRKLLPVH